MEHILTILLLSIVSALVGFGFKRMQDYDMIFRWYSDWLETLSGKNKFLYYFTKPFGRCIICNTTWIGMLLTFILFPVLFKQSSLLVFDIIIVGVASAGIVVLITNKYETMQNAL